MPGFPPFQDKAAARECWRLFMESFPDDHLTVTSKRFINKGIDISVTDAGKIKSHRLYWDTATVMAQLGLMPERPELAVSDGGA